MILLAKQAAKIYTICSFSHQVLFIPIYLISYNLFGLLGLGLSYFLNVLVQFVTYSLINRYKYHIKLKRSLNLQLLIIIVTIIFTIVLRNIENALFRYLLGFCILIFSCLYSYKSMKEVMNIDICEYIKNIKK